MKSQDEKSSQGHEKFSFFIEIEIFIYQYFSNNKQDFLKLLVVIIITSDKSISVFFQKICLFKIMPVACEKITH